MTSPSSSVWTAVHTGEDSCTYKTGDLQWQVNDSQRMDENGHSMSTYILANSTTTTPQGNSSRLRRVKNLFTKRSLLKFVKARLPIIEWLPKYSKSNLYYDIIAGMTVGLMLVPQSLAYSSLAGLAPEYGLYSSYFGVFLYCFLGTSKDISIGPVALISILVEKYTEKHLDTLTFATTLALFSGIVLIAMASFRLHFLISFISVPVLSGFTSAAAIKIGVTQIKGVLGLKIPRGSFFETIQNFFHHIHEARLADSILSISCLILLIVLRKLSQWNNKRKLSSNASTASKVCSRVLWFLCTARFTLAVVITTILAQILYENYSLTNVFILAGQMKGGVPKPRIPLQSVIEADNTTMTKSEIMDELSTGFFITPLVAFLETIAVAKTLARKNGYNVNVTQELFALGVVNVVSSFFLSFPVAGSFSRSALNSQCGIRTPLGGVFTGIVVVLALSFLTPWFKYIPKATLAAMVIAAVIPLFEYKMVRTLWRTKRIDLVPMAVAFFLCFYETELGILAGVATALTIFLYHHVQLQLSINPTAESQVIKIKSQYVYYPSGEQLTSRIEKTAKASKPPPKTVIVDFQDVAGIDSTTATLIKQLWISMEASVEGPKLRFCNLNNEVETILVKTGIDTSKVTDIEMTENICGNGQTECH